TVDGCPECAPKIFFSWLYKAAKTKVVHEPRSHEAKQATMKCANNKAADTHTHSKRARTDSTVTTTPADADRPLLPFDLLELNSDTARNQRILQHDADLHQRYQVWQQWVAE